TKEGLDIIKEGEEEVVQVLLRNGADLSNLDKSANKPIDFQAYFYERKTEIASAVDDFLCYKSRAADYMVRSLFKFPYLLIRWLQGQRRGRYITVAVAPENARGSRKRDLDHLEFSKVTERAQASRQIFESARIQEAVNEEWVHGGCKRKAIRLLILYLLYILVFSLSAVFNSGQNRPHGFFITESLRQSLIKSPYSREDSPNPTFTDIEAPADFWLWAKGPLYSALYASSADTAWYDGSELKPQGGGVFVNGFTRLLGTVRISQWRTFDTSCTIWPPMEDVVSYCFADFCTANHLGTMCFGSTDDKSAFGPGLKFSITENAH
ncbi:unnamed protein product, partial [Chrysoparadoxa australica]